MESHDVHADRLRFPCEEPQTDRVWWHAVAIVIVVGLATVFYELDGYRTLTKHEGFVAVVSREMLQTGDWIVPRFGGIPRLKKPPLAYWVAAATSWVVGEHAAWTVRLPSAMAAVLLAGLIGFWAGRWYGKWCGLAAGLVQITSVLVLSFSRKAEVDMLLCLLTTSALFLVAHSPRDENAKSRGLRWFAIYCLVGLSWLAKFHYGPVMVLSVVAVWLAVDRRRPGLWDVFNPAGLLVLAAAVVIWPWLVLERLPEAWSIWQAETVGRAVGTLGRDPFWYYIPQVFVLALPWSVLLYFAIRTSFRRAWKDNDTRERFLWVWFLTQFAILSASAFKHHHYLMAAMPAISLVLGRTLAQSWARFGTGQLSLPGPILAVLCLAVIGVGTGLGIGVGRKYPQLQTDGMLVAVGLTVSGLVICICLATRRWMLGAYTAGLGFVICYGVINTSLFPQRDSRLPEVALAREINRSNIDRPIHVFGLKEDPIYFYLTGQISRVEDTSVLEQKLTLASQAIVLTNSAWAEQLSHEGLKVEPATEPENDEDSELKLYRITLPTIARKTGESPIQ